MKRRQAVSTIAVILGGSMVGSQLFLTGCKQTEKKANITDFSPEQVALLDEVGETIIPTTNTPGAKAAGVEKFIVRVVKDCYTKDEQKVFYDGLAKLDGDSKTKFGKGFADLDTAQKNEMVKQTTVDNKPFFLKMKELTVTGYFTSEIGATKALEYLPIPGRFEGCVPLKPGQKAWAL